MSDTGGTPQACNERVRPARLSGPVPWIVLAVCCASFIVYLVLHTRELRLLGKWLTSR